MSSSRSSSVAAREPGPAGGRRLADREDGLTRPILPRTRKRVLRRVPEIRHRARLADQHARRRPAGLPREHAAALARGHDVDPEVAQRAQLSALGTRDEAAEAAPRDVLEEHALHGILRAEPEDLLALGLDELGRQARNCRRRFRTFTRPRNHGSFETSQWS